jgi:GTP cyclohydrolase III
MKKIAMILFAAGLMVSFAACNGAKKTEEAVEPVTTVDETQATVAADTATYVEPTPAEALKAFQEFAKEYGEAYNNITKDPGKYTKLASQVQQKVADIERLKVNLSAKEIKDYEKALKIITDVNSGGKK